eukprot:TRINITY_DN11619_c0_g1_i3.p1 TRINITY_DN11619_c0_g1~~TRINITY_DN11619_c0_g1_i3.p1  ORF type:complete len:585 (-),score=147.77 TRINITY_DN11619_c0_g1_i3:133-1887(-)
MICAVHFSGFASPFCTKIDRLSRCGFPARKGSMFERGREDLPKKHTFSIHVPYSALIPLLPRQPVNFRAEWRSKTRKMYCTNHGWDVEEEGFLKPYLNSYETPFYRALIGLEKENESTGSREGLFKEKPEFLLVLGMMYLNGLPQERIPKDQSKGLEYLTRAAQKLAEAEYCLGMLYLCGEVEIPVPHEMGKENSSIPDSRALAIEYLERASRKGNVNAMYNLSLVYLKEGSPSRESGGKIDYEKLALGARHLEEAVKRNHKKAIEFHQNCLLETNSTSTDISLAEQGEVEAMFALWNFYHSRWEEELRKEFQDIPKVHEMRETSKMWLNRAVEGGHLEANLTKGLALVQGGLGFEKDVEEGINIISWCAAEDGNREGLPRAQMILGTLYVKGKHVEKDVERGVALWERSAKAGFPIAVLFLGVVLARGLEGVKQDLEKGLEILLEASRKGIVFANFHLGIVYWLEKGDKERAWKYMSEAAQHGFPHALYILGMWCLNGGGDGSGGDGGGNCESVLDLDEEGELRVVVNKACEGRLLFEKDENQAKEYLLKAQSTGHKLASEILEKIRKQEDDDDARVGSPSVL